jgi:hypothetical protein
LSGESDSGNATDIRVSEDPSFLVSMSVWATIEPLFDFVYRSAHTAVMARRRRWFEKPTEAYQVLWWVPAGQVPSVLGRFRAVMLCTWGEYSTELSILVRSRAAPAS